MAKRLGPIFILALIFSCEDPNEIGLNLNPGLQNLEVRFIEIPLEASNLQLDSVNSTINGQFMMGRIDDPVFGVTTATAYSQVRPSSFTTSFPEGVAFDSLILSVNGTYLYGDGTGQTQNISIHQLSEGIVDTIRYFTFDTRQFNNESIGELNFTVGATRPDTLRLSTRLDDDFGMTLFDAAVNNDDAFENTTSFDEYFKGLSFVSDPSNSMIFSANPEDPETVMSLYYSTSEDTVARRLNFTFNAFVGGQFNGNSYFSNISTDRTGTPVAGITERFTEFDPIDNKVFLQAGNALYPKIKLDALREFAKSNNIKVNRADIVIERVEAFDDGLVPPESLFFFITNETNNFIPFSSGTVTGLRAVQQESAAPFAVGNELVVPFEQDSERQFEGSVTLYVQAGIVDELLAEPEDLLLVPSRFSSTINRVSFDTSNIKLRLFYTTFE
ncbi:DUF4270 family protein [Fulvivirgaceae bacterium BMA12]|uniref:DUF4270 family protein n=1 Tax=Agaribacillus aureus TaxID=3051825 RepID=A0ABT8LH38_9BACT|nr:DUF4270 family protein [Fulvivirgaceae bacterium BMA12]